MIEKFRIYSKGFLENTAMEEWPPGSPHQFVMNGVNFHLRHQGLPQAGYYCIEVPLGDFRVDFRVWGMVHSPKTSYTCTGSEGNIDIGTAPNRCGENCKKIDIMTDCKEFTPRRRR